MTYPLQKSKRNGSKLNKNRTSWKLLIGSLKEKTQPETLQKQEFECQDNSYEYEGVGGFC